MDLKGYSLEDIILTAIKSEVEANTIYTQLAERVKNSILKDRLRFLAAEEAKHMAFIEALHRREFPGKPIVLPERTPVPMPGIEIPAEHVPLSKVIKSAMDAERAASQFYTAFARSYTKDPQVTKMLQYFASMEMTHYEVLEHEKDTADKLEDFDGMWPMMHAGP
jgi:rubrerythrin